VIGGFLETSGSLYVMMFSDSIKVPKVVDFSLDYISPGRHTDTFARCKVVRQGRKIANVSITAWQSQESTPIATARAHFLLM
jgi:acyl-coenzyme A thioesterase PaaI-like protein